MFDSDIFNQGDTDLAYKDMITLMLLGFVVLFFILIYHIGESNNDENEIETPGNLSIELIWPSDSDIDLDLWLLDPAGTRIGYMNKESRNYNLVRDDLGEPADPFPSNYENIFGRGLREGEYIINVHFYRTRESGVRSVEATVRFTIRSEEGRIIEEHTRTDTIEFTKEVTFFRFKLDSDGKIVPNSMHRLPKSIRFKGNSNE